MKRPSTPTIAPLLLLAVALFSACDHEKSSSSYAVNFYCDATFAPFNQVFSYGQFITVRRKSPSEYYVTDATGHESVRTLSESEARSNYQYGLGGLIIGTPSLGDGALWAYDLACPNCDRAKYRLALSYDATGRAECSHCGRVYDLNSSGISIEGGGRRLWSYRVGRNGSYLFVQN